MSFTERTPNERGFARVYESRVRPVLDELATHRRQLEARRQRRMRYFGGLALVSTGVAAAAAFGAFSQVSGLWAPVLIVISWITLLVSFPALLIVWGRPAIVSDDATRRRLLPIVAEHLGLTYDRDASDPPDPTPFLRCKLITRATFGRFDDALTANIGGVSVTILCADFANRGDASAADWQGLLLQAELPASAPAMIRIGGDETWRLADGFTSLSGLPNGTAAAEADATEAAKAWLPPALLDRLEEMRQRFDPGDKGHLRATIDGTRFRLSLRDPDNAPLPMPDPADSSEEIEDAFHKLIADAALPRDIAAALGRTPS